MTLRFVAVNKNELSFGRGREILSLAVYNPTNERIENILNMNYSGSNSGLYRLQEETEVLGVIGFVRTDDSVATILHIAVAETCRGKNYGRTMIDGIVQIEKLKRITAETDREAVEFYKKCGFTVVSIGEKYPGIERFLCCLEMK